MSKTTKSATNSKQNIKWQSPSEVKKQTWFNSSHTKNDSRQNENQKKRVRFDDGKHQVNFHHSPKDSYRQNAEPKTERNKTNKKTKAKGPNNNKKESNKTKMEKRKEEILRPLNDFVRSQPKYIQGSIQDMSESLLSLVQEITHRESMAQKFERDPSYVPASARIKHRMTCSKRMQGDKKYNARVKRCEEINATWQKSIIHETKMQVLDEINAAKDEQLEMFLSNSLQITQAILKFYKSLKKNRMDGLTKPDRHIAIHILIRYIEYDEYQLINYLGKDPNEIINEVMKGIENNCSEKVTLVYENENTNTDMVRKLNFEESFENENENDNIEETNIEKERNLPYNENNENNENNTNASENNTQTSDTIATINNNDPKTPNTETNTDNQTTSEPPKKKLIINPYKKTPNNKRNNNNNTNTPNKDDTTTATDISTITSNDTETITNPYLTTKSLNNEFHKDQRIKEISDYVFEKIQDIIPNATYLLTNQVTEENNNELAEAAALAWLNSQKTITATENVAKALSEEPQVAPETLNNKITEISEATVARASKKLRAEILRDTRKNYSGETYEDQVDSPQTKSHGHESKKQQEKVSYKPNWFDKSATSYSPITSQSDSDSDSNSSTVTPQSPELLRPQKQHQINKSKNLQTIETYRHNKQKRRRNERKRKFNTMKNNNP